MHIEFNYRYYEDENQSKDYHLIMEECLDLQLLITLMSGRG